MAEPTSGRQRPVPDTVPPAMDIVHDLLRGSPTVDLRYALEARAGRLEIKVAAAFDGQDYAPDKVIDAWLRRISAELNARATTSLVVKDTQAVTRAATGTQGTPRTAESPVAPTMSPPADPETIVQQQLRAAEAQGWIRIEGDEIAAGMVWRDRHLTINGKDMDALLDLAQGFTGR